jgi:protein O-mannosyl-transferase
MSKKNKKEKKLPQSNFTQKEPDIKITKSGNNVEKIGFNKFINNYSIFIILIIPAIIYFKSVFFDFSGLDDKTILVNNTEIFNDISNIGRILTTDAFLSDKGVFFRPLQNLSFLIEYQIAGNNPWIFHFTNLILHSITCLILFFLLLSLKFPRNNSLVLTLIFAVNPVFVHAVAWIPARNDLLLALFCLISFFYFIKYCDRKKASYLILNSIFFLFGLFSKETALAFPLIFVLYYILIKKEKIFSKDKILPYFLWLLIIGFWLLVRGLTIGFDLNGVDSGITVLARNLLVIPESISKFIIPINLPVISVFNTLRSISGLVIIIVFVCIIFKTDKQYRKYYIFGFLWFVILLLPGSFARHPYADNFYDYLDHRSYLPFAGLILIIISFFKNDILNIKNKAYFYIFAIIIILFSLITFFRLDEYKNPFVFWRQAISDNPERGMSYSELGINFQKAGQLDSAEKYLEYSKKIFPDYYNNYRALGQLYSDKKDYNEAIEMLKRSLILNPENIDQKLQLGFAYYNTGRYRESVNEWAVLMKQTGETKMLLVNLFEAYFALQSFDTAYVFAKKLALMGEIGPQVKFLSENFKTNYIAKKYLKAIESGMELIRLTPANIIIYKNLSSCYTEIGDLKNAELILLDAAGKYPNQKQTHYLLMEYYLKQNTLSKAVKEAKIIEKLGGNLDPNVKQLLNKYGSGINSNN